VLRNINAVRKLGVRFCLDDFGTFLAELLEAPADRISQD
jgi:EAL domain-containing protein (putative c-di-GMP-specific phosphodiesterase class I)